MKTLSLEKEKGDSRRYFWKKKNKTCETRHFPRFRTFFVLF